MSERTVLERIASGVRRRPGVMLGIGDDAAVLATPATVATHDMLVAGVHFRLTTTSARDLGHKALAVNLSDLAAMGAQPIAALVGLGLSAADDVDIGGLYAGLEGLAAAVGMTIAGGDVTAAPVLTIGVTALGYLPEGGAALTRAGGRAGDLLCVTGTIGDSRAGRALLEDPTREALLDRASADRLRDAHRRPTPRLAEGLMLRRVGAHAAIDCSDGLALDASRLAAHSDLAAELDLDAVPVSAAARAVLGSAEVDPVLAAIAGGEDYELICALDPDALGRFAASGAAPLTVVGRLVAGAAGAITAARDGAAVALSELGWEHDVAG